MSELDQFFEALEDEEEGDVYCKTTERVLS
jgi:hypothetical protein